MHPVIEFRRCLFLVLLGLVGLAGGCANRPPAATGPFPQYSEFAGRLVTGVEFEGQVVLPRDSLQEVVATRPSRCRLLGILPFCAFGQGRDEYRLDLAALAEDVARLRLYYRDHGYWGTQVIPEVEPVGDERVGVRFRIDPGDRVALDNLAIEGTDTIVPLEQLRRRLPLREGAPFTRIGFLASSDSIRAELLRRGYAYSQVLRNYSLDTIADVAEAEFQAIPGPLVRIDTIIVVGGEGLGEQTVRRQLAISEGEILRATQLNESQRNLFDLELVSFASVELAPDSLQFDPDRANATVIVRVVEAPRYLVDASTGFGTVDCLRGQVAWTDRNFLGGGRRLQLLASASKVGARDPVDANLDESLCPGARGDTLLSEGIDYRLVAEFQQPRLFGSRNLFTVRAFAEQVSELDAYLREARGGQFALVRRVAAQTLLTATANVEHVRTVADPVIFCRAFETCDPVAIRELRQFRWSNTLGLSAIRDRSVGNPYPTSGYQVRGAVDWGPPAISDDRFLRFLSEGAAYRQLRPGFVLAGRLIAGTFLVGEIRGDQFIPPERRFYAGGPNSVRGFQRNALGARVYVREAFLNRNGEVELGAADDAAVGGTQMLVASAELRTPSPILRDLTRFAVFVDAGQVWTEGDEFDAGSLRITPGLGLRIFTPVGPIRVEAAYNPYERTPGPLYLSVRETGELVLLRRDFAPEEERRFIDRIQLHIAVGQAF